MIRPTWPQLGLIIGLYAATLVACGGDRPVIVSVGEMCTSTETCESSLCFEETCLSPARDDDLDGLINELEAQLGTNPLAYDTDGDGVGDYHEVSDLIDPLDKDGDGLIDAVEPNNAETGLNGSPPDNDCIPDELDTDNTKKEDSKQTFYNLACCCWGPCDTYGLDESGDLVSGGAMTVEVLSANDCEVGRAGPEALACTFNVEGVSDDRDDDGIPTPCDPCPDYKGEDPAYPNDSDKDSVWDCEDNCPTVWNGPDPTTGLQADGDGDGVGDVCDTCTDADGDGFCTLVLGATSSELDNCPQHYNPEQEDSDGDGTGDACQTETTPGDFDGDGVDDVADCAPSDATASVPVCSALIVCGDDGCGGSCGTCADGQSCEAGACVVDCVPMCSGVTCGDDGCGGSCGECGEATSCVDGQCTSECVPDCAASTCGDDGCGGSCGACLLGLGCSEGVCVANACDVTIKMETTNFASEVSWELSNGNDELVATGGDYDSDSVYLNQIVLENGLYSLRMLDTFGDGWSDSRVTFIYTHSGEEISTFELLDGDESISTFEVDCTNCVPDCAGLICGPHLCGGQCGSCEEGQSCDEGQCQSGCVPDCDGRVCGGDGCGGTCGECDASDQCTVITCDDEAGQCLIAGIDCAPSGPCETVSCEPEVGCVYTPTPGLPCDDGDPITFEESCSEEAVCEAIACEPACSGDDNCVGGHCAPCTSVDTFEPDQHTSINPQDDTLLENLTSLDSGVGVTRSICPANDVDWFIYSSPEVPLRVVVNSEVAKTNSASVRLRVHSFGLGPGGSTGMQTIFDFMSPGEGANIIDVVVEPADLIALEISATDQGDATLPIDAYTVTATPTTCTPECSEGSCGDDGCGGYCDDCDDQDPCTDDGCDLSLDTCIHLPVSCDDNDPCTIDSCGEGGCVYEPALLLGCPECTPGVLSSGYKDLEAVPNGEVVVRGNVIWLGTEGNVYGYGLEPLQSTTESDVVASFQEPNSQLARIQNYLVAASDSSIRFWDIATAQSPTQHWATGLGGVIRDVTVRNDTVVTLHDAGLTVFTQGSSSGFTTGPDVTMESNPYHRIAIKGTDRVVLLTDNETTITLSIASLDALPNFELLSEPVTLLGKDAFDLVIKNTIAYVATDQGVETIQVSANNPVIGPTIPLTGGARAVFVQDGVLFVAPSALSEPIRVYGLSAETGPTLLGTLPVSSTAIPRGIRFDEGWLYIAAEDGVHALEVGCEGL